MSGYDFDLATPMCIMWSLGSAQITYPAYGPATFGLGLCRTVKMALGKRERRRRTLGGSWRPFAVATVTLVPVAGGIVAGKMINAGQ
jgi:hypothetical protein